LTPTSLQGRDHYY